VTGRRILVVDDDQDTREGLRLLLELEGHHVTEAADGAEALALALSGEPEVIFLDIGLPQVDGFHVAERLREVGVKAFLVALTGYVRDQDFARARSIGFDAFIAKPADTDQLLRMIERVSD
jgi:CheY-like chemotaxis protein